MTSKINRVHHPSMANMSVKFDEVVHNGLVSIMFTSLLPNYVYYDLDLWPITSKINRVHPLTMTNMSAKFDEGTHNGLVYRVHKLISIYIYCDLDLWPMASKTNTVHHLVILNMCVMIKLHTANLTNVKRHEQVQKSCICIWKQMHEFPITLTIILEFFKMDFFHKFCKFIRKLIMFIGAAVAEWWKLDLCDKKTYK